MSKIFFACSMRGGFNQVDQVGLKKIPELIESLGHSLMSKHQTNNNFIELENNLAATAIFERDLNWIKECDYMIAEISNPSLGTGGEIVFASNLNKPVLCIYKNTISEKNVSAFIRGMDGSEYSKTVKCEKYGDLEELKGLIEDFIK